MRIEVDGIEEAQRKVRSLLSALTAKDVNKVLVKGMKLTTASAKSIVSVRSGLLKKNIKTKSAKQGANAYLASAYTAVDRKRGTGAPHGYLVEAGTKFAPAHPFLAPAFTATQSAVKATIEQGLKQLVEGAVK